ncbi:MAG TPA: hypothetical protein VF189_01535 [Patescibacteria group bacterium]
MKKHLGYYISFLLILGGGIYAVFSSQSDKSLQMKFVVMLAGAYVIWGILHHYIHHSVTLRLIVEYIVVAALGVAVVFFILNGGI